MKKTTLEESFPSQSEHIRNLCIKLEVANNKSQIQESYVLQQREVFDEQKRSPWNSQSNRFSAKVNSRDVGVPRRQTHSWSADSRLSYN